MKLCKSFIIKGLILGLVSLIVSCQNHTTTLHIYGSPENDLIQLLEWNSAIDIIFHKSPASAISQAQKGEAVMILSIQYPDQQVRLDEGFYNQIKEKELRAFIEFPSYVPGIKLGTIMAAKAERALVNQPAFFDSDLDSLQILGINGLHYIKSDVEESLLTAAQVAGFDEAIFGLPEKVYPLLFQWQKQPVLISTTNLNQFISGRYAPRKEWGIIWESILRYLLPNSMMADLQWEPTVATSFNKAELLPADFQKISVHRGIEWYKNARMPVPAAYEDTLQSLLDSGNQRLAYDLSIPVGNGSEGVFECIFSNINENGNQPIGIIKRGDCISETAMAFATAGELFDNEDYKSISKNLLNFYLENSIATKKEYGNPNHPAYGLIPWGISSPAWFKASYGDDNARFLLGAFGMGFKAVYQCVKFQNRGYFIPQTCLFQ